MSKPKRLECTKCGGSAGAGDRFCTTCGSHLPVATDETQSGEGPKGHWKATIVKIAIISAVAICILLIAIPICNRVFPEHPDPYEGLASTAEQIRSDIAEINAETHSRCPNIGLSDPAWVCPQVTQAQAKLMIARSMAKAIENNDEKLDERTRYTQETREYVTEALYTNIKRMGYQNCTPDREITLTSEILTEVERAGFIERCGEGWNLTKPWTELIARQAPPPTPDWAEYRRHLDPEFVP